MMLSMFHAGLMETALVLAAALALAGAIAAFVYLPIVGRPLAAVLLAIAAALAAYDFGYAARGRLDESGALQSQLTEEKRQSAASQDDLQRAAAREQARSAQVDQLNERISDYERQLAARTDAPAPVQPANCPALDRSTCGCLLGDADVRGLRDIRATGTPPASGAAGGVRPARRSP